MKRALTNSLAIALFAASIAAPSSVNAAQNGPPDIVGQWSSAEPEPQGQIFATREFKIETTRWSVFFRAYADEAGKAPLFTINVGGDYVLGGPSKEAPGAVEGIFPAIYRKITAESEAGAKMFAAMGCQLDVGVAKPLVSEGCGFVPSQMEAMGEYDLVALKDGHLFFGDRSGDLTKARPKTLTPYPLIRR